jgi:hypothetical protein
MSEQIIPVSTDLWLIIEPAALDSDGLFMIRDSVSGEVMIDKDEVPALIDVLHKFLDEYGGPKEQVNG